jgi:antiviral helicase SKI2
MATDVSEKELPLGDGDAQGGALSALWSGGGERPPAATGGPGGAVGGAAVAGVGAGGGGAAEGVDYALKVIDPSAPCREWPPPNYVERKPDGSALFPYALDPFQTHAIAAICKGENVLVTAKTGSGKTAVGLYAIAHALAAGARVFYSTPIKALSNQKYAELRATFPDVSVGIMTGDLKFNPDAQVVVLTQEILRNKVFSATAGGGGGVSIGLSAELTLEGLGVVVMDEAHYFQDPERGHAWEESLILLPPEVTLVLLSATIAAPEAFASWLCDVRKTSVTLVSTAYRVVPLVFGVVDPKTRAVLTVKEGEGEGAFREKVYTEWLRARKERERAAEKFKAEVAAAPVEQRAAVAAAARGGGGGGGGGGAGDDDGGGGGGSGKPRQEAFKHVLNDTLRLLQEKELTPALFFVLSRKDCEKYAASVEGSLLDSSDAASVRHVFDFYMHRHRAVLEPMQQYHTLRDLLLRGLAFHHSGVLPLLKEMVEILFSRGLVKALFATETFAVGLNMPTKTVRGGKGAGGRGGGGGGGARARR